MPRLIAFLGLFLVLFSPTLSVSDRRCGSNMSRIWLDVVFVIDTSKSMNMYRVYETIQALFDPQVQIGTGYSDPRSTRVGFITYNWNATDVADFYKLQSWNELSSQIQRLKVTPLSNVVYSYLDVGLNSAIQMINKTGGFRDNYRKMVVVFTSNYGHYRAQPSDLARYLKSIGTTVVTVNTGSSKSVSDSLKNIADLQMNFAMTDGNTTQELAKAMIDTNCYCPYTWHQYMWPISNPQNRYGTCLYVPTGSADRDSARLVCHSLSSGRAYLANELDQQKRSYNFDLLGPRVNAFYNGLLNVNNTWYWDQPDGRPLLKLDPNSGSPPPRSSCVADMKYSDGTTSWTPVGCSNQFTFLCEMTSCDTDNYCDEKR